MHCHFRGESCLDGQAPCMFQFNIATISSVRNQIRGALCSETRDPAWDNAGFVSINKRLMTFAFDCDLLIIRSKSFHRFVPDTRRSISRNKSLFQRLNRSLLKYDLELLSTWPNEQSAAYTIVGKCRVPLITWTAWLLSHCVHNAIVTMPFWALKLSNRKNETVLI